MEYSNMNKEQNTEPNTENVEEPKQSQTSPLDAITAAEPANPPSQGRPAATTAAEAKSAAQASVEGQPRTQVSVEGQPAAASTQNTAYDSIWDSALTKAPEPLTEEETSMVQKFCLYPVLAIACIISAIIIGGPWILMNMIDDIALDSEGFYEAGLWVYIALAILGMVGFIYFFGYTRFGKKRRAKWATIVEKAHASQTSKDFRPQTAAAVGTMAAGHLLRKAGNETLHNLGTAAEIAGDVQAVGVAASMSYETYKNGKAVANAIGIQVPRARKYVVGIILIPMLILVAAYIPEFMHSAQARSADAAKAAASVKALEDTFQDGGCVSVIVPDPEADPKDNYRVYAYLNKEEYNDATSRDVSISVELDRVGTITGTSYSSEIDMDLTKEENLKRAQTEFTKMNKMLRKAGVAAEEDKFLTNCTISDEFRKTFTAGSYYDSIEGVYERDSDTSRIISSDYFYTDAKEEFDQYTRPRIQHYVN